MNADEASSRTGNEAPGQAGHEAAGQTGHEAAGETGHEVSGQIGREAGGQIAHETPGQTGHGAPGETGAELIVSSLRSEAGGSVRAVVLYGSHLSGAQPDSHSAIDLLVIVDSYSDFYGALAREGRLRRSERLMNWLSHLLPPNVIAYAPPSTAPALAKCLVLSTAHFERAMGSKPPDHFVLCRMIQWVEVIHAASDAERRAVEATIESARMNLLEWIAPYMKEPLDVHGFAERFLEVCFQGEIRPETRSRASALAKAQMAFLEETYAPVLADAAQKQFLIEHDGRYLPAVPANPREARRWAMYFRRSRIRASARWMKHIVTFDDWFPYMVRKAERHSGKGIPVTRLESEWPLLFMWPRALAFLREQSRTDSNARRRWRLPSRGSSQRNEQGDGRRIWRRATRASQGTCASRKGTRVSQKRSRVSRRGTRDSRRGTRGSPSGTRIWQRGTRTSRQGSERASRRTVDRAERART